MERFVRDGRHTIEWGWLRRLGEVLCSVGSVLGDHNGLERRAEQQQWFGLRPARVAVVPVVHRLPSGRLSRR